MRLQNMRFGNTVDFVVDIPDSMMDIPIPTLIFQPIIENALLHGIFEKESKAGTILREERMKHAAELLANKTTNLYHIAAECGYENITAFADNFRYYYGTSPEEYREQLI